MSVNYFISKQKRALMWYTSIICMCFSLSSCLQKDADYYGEPLNPKVNMTAWEYMQSRPDAFSRMIEAVNYTGLSGYYSQTSKKYTYLLLNNVAMNQFLSKYGAGDFVAIDVEKVKKLLLYHIINGEYHAYNQKLPIEPMYVKTFLEGQDGLLTIKVEKSDQSSAVFQDQIINGNVVVNDNGSNFSSGKINSVTTNILSNNGPIHVFRDYAFYKRSSTYQTAY